MGMFISAQTLIELVRSQVAFPFSDEDIYGALTHSLDITLYNCSDLVRYIVESPHQKDFARYNNNTSCLDTFILNTLPYLPSKSIEPEAQLNLYCIGVSVYSIIDYTDVPVNSGFLLRLHEPSHINQYKVFFHLYSPIDFFSLAL